MKLVRFSSACLCRDRFVQSVAFACHSSSIGLVFVSFSMTFFLRHVSGYCRSWTWPLGVRKVCFQEKLWNRATEIREAQADFNYVGSDREGDQSVYLVGSGLYEVVLLKDNQATIRSIESGKSPFVTATRLNGAPQVISQQAWKLQNPLSLQGLS